MPEQNQSELSPEVLVKMGHEKGFETEDDRDYGFDRVIVTSNEGAVRVVKYR